MAIYINGKRVDNKPFEKKPVKVIDRVAAGEEFSFSGDVTITGDIEEGAVVDIKNGGLVVEGNIGDKAKIRVEQGQSDIVSGNVSVGNISVSGSSNVVISTGGKTVFNSQASGQDTHNGLTVMGHIGKNVTLASDESVTLNGQAKDFLDVCARHSINGSDSTIGAHATVIAGHSIRLGTVGSNSILNAGHSIKVAVIHNGCTATAGHSIKVDKADHTARFQSGHKTKIGTTLKPS